MCRYFILVFFCLININAYSGLEDHFKKAENKLEIHRMKNIDFIYMINLDERPEKFETSCNQLHPYNIFPYRFSAINGWELNYETLNDIGLKFQKGMKKGLEGAIFYPGSLLEPKKTIIQETGQVYFRLGMRIGLVGIVLSHLSVLQDALDSGYETIWVMEDDIEVIKDPRILSDLIDKLDNQVGSGNWDILFTDIDTKDPNGNRVICRGLAPRPNFDPPSQDQYYKNIQISDEFRELGARFGAYSMILRKSGIEKILNFFKTHSVFQPYDIDFYYPEGIKIYTVLDDVVSTLPNALSDNLKPNYKKQNSFDFEVESRIQCVLKN